MCHRATVIPKPIGKYPCHLLLCAVVSRILSKFVIYLSIFEDDLSWFIPTVSCSYQTFKNLLIPCLTVCLTFSVKALSRNCANILLVHLHWDGMHCCTTLSCTLIYCHVLCLNLDERRRVQENISMRSRKFPRAQLDEALAIAKAIFIYKAVGIAIVWLWINNHNDNSIS